MNTKTLIALTGTIICLQGCGSFQMKWFDFKDKTDEPVVGDAPKSVQSACLTALRTTLRAPAKPSSNEVNDRRRSYQPVEHQPVGEVVLKANGGEKFTVSTRVVPISGPNEDLSGLIGLGACTVLNGKVVDVWVYDVEIGH